MNLHTQLEQAADHITRLAAVATKYESDLYAIAIVIDLAAIKIEQLEQELAGAREALDESRQTSQLWERTARQIDL